MMTTHLSIDLWTKRARNDNNHSGRKRSYNIGLRESKTAKATIVKGGNRIYYEIFE